MQNGIAQLRIMIDKNDIALYRYIAFLFGETAAHLATFCL